MRGTLVVKGLNQKTDTRKHLAKIPGRLSSMHVALGLIVRLFFKEYLSRYESRFSWHETKGISKETEDKQKLRLKNINSYNIMATHLNLDH